MRLFMVLAAAVLFGTAAGEARAAMRTDPQCSSNVGTPQQRIGVCTRFIERLRPGFETNPYIANALEMRAEARSQLSDCAGAISDINTAMQLTASYNNYPTVQTIRYRMHIQAASIYLNCPGDVDGALAVLGRATQFKPGDPAAFAGRGLMFSEKGDFKSAHAEIAKAQRLMTDNTNRSYVLEARAVILERQGRADEAMVDLDEAIRLNPSHSFSYADRGSLYRMRGDLARALTDLNIAVRLNPENTSILSRRGEVLRYRGDFAGALADYNRTLQLYPHSVQALTGRGLIYERLGDLARAKDNFEQAIASPQADTIRVRQPRDTARARLAALDAGGAQPVIPAAPAKVASETSVPTPVLAAPILSKPVATAQPPAVRQGRRVALVVGNSAYRRVPELINPRNDANAIAASLRNVGFDTVMQISDTTHEHLADALRMFAGEAAKADWAMVYYAGHGIEVNGRNYLLPVDARLAADRDVQSEGVLLDQVMASLEGARKLKLVVLDACRDNPFAPQMQRTATVADAGGIVPTISSTGGARSVGRGLGEVNVSGASLVVFAAKHGQTALDGEGGNSPFAIALVQRIATPGVEINKIFRLVRDDVMEATAGRQEPYTYGSLPGREDFFFVASK
jgi:tetratricopeptide (TPR) repeat protein